MLITLCCCHMVGYGDCVLVWFGQMIVEFWDGIFFLRVCVLMVKMMMIMISFYE